MKKFEKRWLERVPWQTVLTLNQTLCQAQNTAHQLNEKSRDTTRQLWENAVARRMTLPEALDLLKQCYSLSPFIFNNGNTFAAIAKTLIEEWVRTLPPLEAQIIRNTVGHYVAGLVGKKELVSVLSHFEPTWKPAMTAAREPAPQPEPAPSKPAAVVAPPLGAEQVTS